MILWGVSLALYSFIQTVQNVGKDSGYWIRQQPNVPIKDSGRGVVFNHLGQLKKALTVFHKQGSKLKMSSNQHDDPTL